MSRGQRKHPSCYRAGRSKGMCPNQHGLHTGLFNPKSQTCKKCGRNPANMEWEGEGK